MQSDLKVVRETLFPKGYNDKYPPEYIPKEFLAEAVNCFVTDEKITKRTGYSMIANDTGDDKPILGLQFVYTSAGVRRMYKFNNKIDNTAIEIWEWNGTGNWSLIDNTLLTGVGNDVNCVIAQDKVFCFDGSSVPVIITPGSPSTVAAVADVNFPRGSFGAWFHDFLFVGGVDSFPDRLYWSDLEDATDFTNGVTGSVDVDPGEADFMTGLNVLKNELLIFKRNRIWSLTGFGTETFTLNDLNENITGFGAVNHRCIVNTGNDVLYMSFVGGDPEFRSVQRTRYGTIVEGGLISDPISGSMKELENTQIDDAAVGIFDGRIVYWAVPSSGNTTNDIIFVYDTVDKGWVKWTGFYPRSFAKADFSGETQIYFGEARDDSRVYVKDSSTNDNGAAIDFYVVTRRYGGDTPERKKKWKYCYVVSEKSGNWDLTVEQSPDGFSYEALGTINLTPTGTTFPITLDSTNAPLGVSDTIRKRLDFGKKTSYYVQLKFSNNNADQEVSIRHWELLYKPRALRDAKP